VSQKKWINIDYVSFGKVKATRKNTDYQNGTSCPKLKIFGKGGGVEFRVLKYRTSAF
jgi:hypothetical protein